MNFYPVFLHVQGRRGVVVGGGAVAEQKVVGLLEAGARVTVVSPDLTWKLEDLAATGAIELRRRGYRRGDLEGAFLAIAATDDRSVNADVWAEAEERGILLNAVDDLPHCSFIAPAVHRAGDIAVAVSTGGKSPALAVRLREQIGTLIGREHAEFLDLLGELRPTVAARVPDHKVRTRLWYQIVDSDGVEYVRRRDLAGARRRIEELVECTVSGDAVAPPRGMVYLVGAGPGDPGLVTVRGLEALRTADVVVYDRLVSRALVERAAPWAERVFVGKRAEGHSIEQEQTNDLVIARARQGLVVVRLKGGDPFVFGRGAEECEALERAGIPFDVVPGVTAAIAAPGAAGIPVTHRRYASAFAVAAGQECEGESDLDWGALARIPTLVFLMGLRGLPHIAARLLAHGARPDTPAAVIASATLPEQHVVVGTLATIATLAREARLESPATLVVGEVVRVPERLAQLAATAAEALIEA
ncbi:MAG TPA: siroheme synthase CysG [Gemmatimonadales bacterium]|jgi:uroporphyrin-III C-methyltransferase/precorrin-2 dehydrogenase/sirohydrochlorin ferrochelatase